MKGAGAAPLLRLEGITRRFPGVVANDDVALDLHGGEVHALLGENGAGKSTLIAILSGVLRPDGGRILLDGREVAMASPRDAIARGIGTVQQHPAPVPTLTVVENLMLGEPWWRRLPRRAARARLRDIGEAFSRPSRRSISGWCGRSGTRRASSCWTSPPRSRPDPASRIWRTCWTGCARRGWPCCW
jgi:ABC-type sugar transport system ATPase subunit